MATRTKGQYPAVSASTAKPRFVLLRVESGCAGFFAIRCASSRLMDPNPVFSVRSGTGVLKTSLPEPLHKRQATCK